ncbi:hypothetical protein [Natronohydrobacter thiooxidans]|uniref:hypothetical protein n=1 Tax=Natronohydrobacter thiooxidans TaxID=87172 RepID=UPI0008FF686E|nr:hypothetical protein [Natronohydrobacter thiooxidans]
MRIISVLLLASVALPAHADTTAQIRGVTLSTAGLAMIEAEGALGAQGLRLAVRRADIDDFLKSLRLSDPAGGVPMLSMQGPGGVQDTFDALPFDPNALSDLRALLGAMIGAPVRAERRGATLEGAVMGTRAMPCDGEGQTGCAALTLRDADGRLRQIALDEALELEFTDSADRDAIGRGLDALRANARALVLDVMLTSSEDSAREVGLGWLQPAPVWKTAWRAEDGPEGITLTGWAVIENTTGQDWDDISLTLATGATQALQAQLYDRMRAARKFAEPAYAPMPAAPMARDSVVMMESAMDIAPTAMDDGAAFSRFTLTTPVTLKAGEMISLPFLSETLDEARLTLYRGGSHESHPMLAVEFTNPLPLRLPAGVVTVYEAGRGHAGDAMMPELVPGAVEVIEFARDTALEIRESVEEANRVQSARIVDGVLVAEDRIERRTTYRIDGAPDRATLLTIAHPRRQGWEMMTTGGRADLDETRFEVDVPEGNITEFAVLESRIVEQRVALLSLDIETLGYWSSRLSDAGISETLGAMQDLRAEEAELRREIARLQTEEAELIADQERLVGLIVQLGDDSPATRERRARVDAIEAEIMAARESRVAAEARIREIDAELRALLR